MSLIDKQLENNSLSNAYIIEGEDVDYNLEFSYDFAKKVFKSYGIVDNLSLNPDFNVIDKDIIDIATVRFLIKDMVIRPDNQKIKIYILHNAQNLRVEAANAMLKSLEELKDYILIIFTVNNIGSLLKTIRSRCQLINLNTQNTSIDIDLEKLSNITSSIYNGDLSEFYKEKDFLLAFKDDKTTLTGGLIKILSDFLDFKYKNIGQRDLTYQYNLDKLSNMSLTSLEKILNRLELINRAYRNNINFELSVENIFLTIYREGRNS